MKLTKKIAKDIQECIEEGFESVSEFAKFANVSTDMVTKYLKSESDSIKADTWQRIQPLLRIKAKKKESHHRVLELNADQKILLDTFDVLDDGDRKDVFAKLQKIVTGDVRAYELKSLTEDENRLLGLFDAVPADQQEAFLLNVVELATLEVRKQRNDFF